MNINAQKDTLNTVKPVWGNINCLLSQFDNDSVNVTQSDLYSGYANGVFVPQVHTQLNMHVSNDSISWTPTMLGNFGTGFQIDEYRNNQLIGTQRIQWTFRVVASRMSIEENITYRDLQYSVYDWYGRYLGNTLEGQKGFLILRYTNGETKKIFKYLYTYHATVERVVDGDTVDALIDLGFDTWKKVRIRMMGMDAWESRTRDKEEKKKGLAAKARLY